MSYMMTLWIAHVNTIDAVQQRIYPGQVKVGHKAAALLSHYFSGTLDDPEWRRAACRGRVDLPWTEDATPSLADFRLMQEVCETCPLIGKCSGFALRQDGGFYAGHWVPWKTTGVDGRDNAALRVRSRQGLKRLALRHGWTCIICNFPNESGVVLCAACGARNETIGTG
jgi:hypothetical protein